MLAKCHASQIHQQCRCLRTHVSWAAMAHVLSCETLQFSWWVQADQSWYAELHRAGLRRSHAEHAGTLVASFSIHSARPAFRLTVACLRAWHQAQSACSTGVQTGPGLGVAPAAWMKVSGLLHTACTLEHRARHKHVRHEQALHRVPRPSGVKHRRSSVATTILQGCCPPSSVES